VLLPQAILGPKTSGMASRRLIRINAQTSCGRIRILSRAFSTGSSRSMDWPDYLRDQAIMYRQQAEQTDDPIVKNELLELASVCEEVANNIEDHLTGG
jgi:hypothetical protein